MTTTQKIDGVPRELLAGILKFADECWHGFPGEEELRTLLDAPIPFPGYPPVPEDRKLPAAQPRGEPVAWQYRVSAGPQTGWSLWHDGKGEEFKRSYQVETRPLYAEQPAPVAVTLQQVLTAYEYAESHPHKHLRGTTNWCAAVARSINSK